jgi:hypothetical protein
MSLSSELRTAGPFVGDGVTSTFPFAFKVFQASDLLIEQTDADGVVSPMELGSDYLVTLNSNQNFAPGGTVTLAAPLALTTTLMVFSNVAALQGVAIQTQGGFYPGVINDALDRLTILVQQLKARPFTRHYPTEPPDGEVTTFNFDGLPSAGHFLLIFNGIINTQGFSQDGEDITFDDAPETDTELYCLF